MTTQLSAVSNNPRFKRNQIAELNARQSRLPQILANKARAEDLARQEEFQGAQINIANRQNKLMRKRNVAQNRASEIGMGLEAAKLGNTIASGGNRTVGGLATSARGLFGGTGVGSGLGSFVDSLNIGSLLGGGLAGFGASKMIGKKKSKTLKGATGAGVGAAIGLLSGGWGGAITGGIGGGLGGLFG